MKTSFLLSAVFTLAIAIVGCNGDNNASSEKDIKITEPHSTLVEDSSATCYILENEKDTVSLSLVINENHVSGKLYYHYFEKDRNTGHIEGQINGDTIFARYTFMSEGIESQREVAFLKNGNTLTEGYASLNTSTGEPDFSNHSAIKFDTAFVLQKSACP